MESGEKMDGRKKAGGRERILKKVKDKRKKMVYCRTEDYHATNESIC